MNAGNPISSDAFGQAIAAYRSGNLAEAEQLCQRIVLVQPNFFDAVHLLALLQSLLGKKDAALASYDRALAIRPDSAEALSNRGVTLHELGRCEEALASYDRALKVRPAYAEALSNRGLTLHQLGRFEEALASYERAFDTRADYAEALCNRGLTLHEVGRFEDALASYDKAIALQPRYVDAHLNRGNTLRELGRFAEELASYAQALELQPNDARVHYNESLCRLLIGDFECGWVKYEWRWQIEQLRAEKRNFSQPLWLGSDQIENKVILLHGEQGFGDVIQFCRYVPLVAERAARVILEVSEPLRELMDDLPGASEIVAKGDRLPYFDVHCPLLSLPLAFKTRLATIPCDTPYLHAPPQAVLRWSKRLGPRTRPRVGLAWSGRPTHKNDRNRSIKLSALLPLLDSDADFVSLQRDVRADDVAVLNDRKRLIHFGDELTNFTDTAALISNLDLVISVDTSVAHVAGALNKTVWVLLPFIPDWRWLLDRDDSPWYPSARLFRQSTARTWDDVIATVARSLRELVQIRPGESLGTGN